MRSIIIVNSQTGVINKQQVELLQLCNYMFLH